MKYVRIVKWGILTVVLILFGYYLGVVSTVNSSVSNNNELDDVKTITGSSIKVVDSVDNTEAKVETNTVEEINLEDLKNRNITSLTLQSERICGKKAEKLVHQWDEKGNQYVAYLGYSSDKVIKKLDSKKIIVGYEYNYKNKKSSYRELTKSYKSGKTYKDVFGKKKSFYSNNYGLDKLLTYEWLKVKSKDDKIYYTNTSKEKGKTVNRTLVVDSKIGRIIEYDEVVSYKKVVVSKIKNKYSGYNTTVIGE